MGKSCCMFGNIIYEERKAVADKMYKVVEELIKEGVDNFYFCGFTPLDLLGTSVVEELQQTYKHIKKTFTYYDCDRGESELPKVFEKSGFSPYEKHNNIGGGKCNVMDEAVACGRFNILESEVVLISFNHLSSGYVYDMLNLAKAHNKIIVRL